MSKLITLSSIRDKVRAAGEWRSNYISDSELTDKINLACNKYRAVVAKADPLRYLQTDTLTLVSGTETYELDSAFLKTIGVYLSDSTTDGYTRLEKFNFEERYDTVQTTPLRYNVIGSTTASGSEYQMIFQPVPKSSGTVKVDFLPTFSDLSADSDTIDVIDGSGLSYIVCDVAIFCAIKEESDPAGFMQQKQDAQQAIILGLETTDDSVKTVYTSNTLGGLKSSVRNIGTWKQEELSDAQLTNWINDACYKFYSMIASVDPLRYLNTEDITVSSGTRTYDLPDDYFKLLGVAVADSSTDGYTQLEAFNFEERFDTYQDSSESTTRFLLHGTDQDGGYQIDFQPTPTWAGTVRVEYIPTFTAITSNSDSIDFINGLGRDWIINDVAIKASVATGKLEAVQVFDKVKKESEQALISSIKQDQSEAKTAYISNTLGGLKLSVRNTGAWKPEDISDAQLTNWINISCNKFYSMVASSDPLRYLSDSTISVVSGTRSYDLPSDYFKMLGVSVADDTTDGYSQIESFKFEERFDANQASSKGSTRFLLHGTDQDGGYQIDFQPTPTWTDTVKIEYIPTFTELSNNSDTMDLIDGIGEGFIVSDVAMRCAIFTGKLDIIAALEKIKMDSAQALAASIKQDITEDKTISTSGTLRDLQISIRNRGNWSREQVTDNQLTAFINSTIAALTDLLYTYDQSLIITESSISVVADTATYSLPTDFYKLVGLSIPYQNGYMDMDRIEWQERNEIYKSSSKLDARYMLVNNQIRIIPTPTWAETLKLEYIPFATALTAPTDIFAWYNSWGEYVILGACVKVCMLLGTPADMYMIEQLKVEERVYKLNHADYNKPKVRVDVTRGNSRSYHNRRYPRFY